MIMLLRCPKMLRSMTINRTHNYNHDSLNINIDINTHYPNHTLPWEKLNAFMVANVSNKIR